VTHSSTATTKKCPQCASLLAAETAACACGHLFTASADAPTSSSDLVTKAEELYESHLRSRLQQALRALKFAKVDALRAPSDSVKLARMRQAERDVRDLETQLAVQAARVAAARSAPKPPDIGSANADSFREAQAAKAREVVEFTRVQEAAKRGETAHGNARFSTDQLEKAEQILKARPSIIHCAGCGLALPEGATICECGFNQEAANAASDFLSAEEKAALKKS
jgi:hypothetical protein